MAVYPTLTHVATAWLWALQNQILEAFSVRRGHHQGQHRNKQTNKQKEEEEEEEETYQKTKAK